MRLLVVVLVLAVATVALLFGPGLLQGGDGSDEPVAPREAPGRTSGGEGPTLDVPAPPPDGGNDSPGEEPAPEMLRLERPLKVLFLMTHSSQRWARVMELALKSDPFVEVSGYELEEQPGTPAFGTGPRPPDGKPPTAAWFDAQDFDVLVLCGFDPHAFETAFWESVAGRVRAGTLGLWAQPGLPLPASAGAPAPETHGLLTHPVLAPLLPVLSAKPIRGSPVPGVFAREAPFALTAAGEKHPASRIVRWPEWSRRIWQVGAAATPPWGTQFSYPVEALKPGSVVLVETQPPLGPPLPMYVQGPLELGRVLWFGAQQIADDTLRNSEHVKKWNALLHNAVVWLAGRAP